MRSADDPPHRAARVVFRCALLGDWSWARPVARWLCERFGEHGRVVATDVDVDFLSGSDLPGAVVLRHDASKDCFPQASFDLIHARLVLMHIPERIATLTRWLSWLADDGWLLVEETDKMAWAMSSDPMWRELTADWARTFPQSNMSAGRELIGEIAELGLVDVDADAEIDVMRGGDAMSEWHRLCYASTRDAWIAGGATPPDRIDELDQRLQDPRLLVFGNVWLGAWGRKPPAAAGQPTVDSA